MTLPQSFDVPPADVSWLHRHDVEILKIPDGLSLGASLAHALILTGLNGSMRLLHGDTLLPGLEAAQDDCISIAQPQGSYKWDQLQQFPGTSSDEVITGWFSLSCAQSFLRSLTLEGGDFIAALNHYAQMQPLAPIHTPEWLDFGHLQTFHQARTKVSTARAFNSLNITNRTVFKSGDKPVKLRNEAAWFAGLPPVMRIFAPMYLGWEDDGYRISYEFNPTLHELLIFGALQDGAWEAIAAGCFEFLENCRVHGQDDNPYAASDLLQELAINKTETRLAEWSQARQVDLHQPWTLNGQKVPSIREIARRTSALIADTSPISGIMHGDFCFPNAFFDFRQQIVKVIDPRGSIRDDQAEIYGDIRYDLAKLNHSIEGYDQILTGRYHYTREGDHEIAFTLAESTTVDRLRKIFHAHHIQGQSMSDPGIVALTIQLFLSMLPLHADRLDRQDAFLANALRLFLTLEHSK
ncbi:capsular biosynthesis protein [Phaeobacter inhibens]|uniref:capsular biosynthesis protein n=1 Tax=Phaeobacter inhibens TaxID=221822 RepID=UPI000F4B3676|nr:capsular biosynthesis protein [Phaeobacter inhibens]